MCLKSCVKSCDLSWGASLDMSWGASDVPQVMCQVMWHELRRITWHDLRRITCEWGALHAPRCIHICDMTHSYMWHDSFTTHEWWMRLNPKPYTWHTHVCMPQVMKMVLDPSLKSWKWYSTPAPRLSAHHLTWLEAHQVMSHDLTHHLRHIMNESLWHTYEWVSVTHEWILDLRRITWLEAHHFTWLASLHMTHMWRDSSICVCDVTCSYMWYVTHSHNSFTQTHSHRYVTWLIHISMWPDSFTYLCEWVRSHIFVKKEKESVWVSYVNESVWMSYVNESHIT